MNKQLFLIYPYWNVNVAKVVLFNFPPLFLIYPYWNVNRDFRGIGLHIYRVSNLSILECKWKIRSHNIGGKMGF